MRAPPFESSVDKTLPQQARLMRSLRLVHDVHHAATTVPPQPSSALSTTALAQPRLLSDMGPYVKARQLFWAEAEVAGPLRCGAMCRIWQTGRQSDEIA